MNKNFYSNGGGDYVQARTYRVKNCCTKFIPDIAHYDNFEISNLLGNILIDTPSGTPYNGQILNICLRSTSSRTITWSSVYSRGQDALISATGISKNNIFSFIWMDSVKKWIALNLLQGT